MAEGDTGLEVGRARVLHPGPLRWLRATGWMVLLFLVFTGFYGGIQFLPKSTPLDALKVLAACVAGFAVYAGAVRLAEGRWPSELKLSHAPVDLLVGAAVGALIMALVIAALSLMGVYQISGPHGGSPWKMLNIAIQSGMMEELAFRAILMRLMMRAFGAWPSLIAQAALFGAAHAFNPGATIVSSVAIMIEAGFLLAAFYMLSNRLWMSVGLHAAWNFTQGWLWGASVSGTPRTPSFFTSEPKPGAPEFLSGGAFGPEASLPCMIVGTLVAALVLWMAWKKGNFKVRPDEPSQASEVGAGVS
ncbi:CPBP family intramembrane glutamic endopeptidase [uncultured Caulobacter sp.]|uniref:CPBP family intramembrane glutamic endopeptidase n=1 Tax=uncultured Caulobacter sp. TaxID=158749 RepID=UPI00261F9618|nr:type II CAAX endopeptidase family protein [uncultured Caulobacter sp.]